MNLLHFLSRGQKAQAAVDETLKQFELFGDPPQRLPSKLSVKNKPKGYFAAPGSGPKGETCGSCAHSYSTKSGSGRSFRKCELVRHTFGPGTDIVLKTAACQGWKQKPKEGKP